MQFFLKRSGADFLIPKQLFQVLQGKIPYRMALGNLLFTRV
jgi:hypothetical protein